MEVQVFICDIAEGRSQDRRSAFFVTIEKRCVVKPGYTDEARDGRSPLPRQNSFVVEEYWPGGRRVLTSPEAGVGKVPQRIAVIHRLGAAPESAKMSRRLYCVHSAERSRAPGRKQQAARRGPVFVP